MPGKCHESNCNEETGGKYLCEAHRRYHREYQSAKRLEWIAAKLCPRCGGKRGSAGSHYRLCGACRADRAAYGAIRKEVAVEAGACSLCLKRPAALVGGKTRPVRQGKLCEVCRADRADRERARRNKSLTRRGGHKRLAAAGEKMFIGQRVCGGEIEEDYDTGTVVNIQGDQVEVAWDSGVRTTQHESALSILESL